MARRTSPHVITQIQDMYARDIEVRDIAKAVGVSYRTAYGYTAGRQRGHESTYAYQRAVAKRQGHATIHEYQAAKVRELHGVDTREYLERLAQERGFDSDAEYKKHLTAQRQERPEYKLFSAAVERGLKRLRLTQEQCARELGIHPQSINDYVLGKSIPKGERKKRLLDLLGINREELEEMVE